MKEKSNNLDMYAKVLHQIKDYFDSTVHFPNSVGKFFPCFVLISARLFHIRSKIFLYI